MSKMDYYGAMCRATRLGEFSPIQRLFTLGSFLKTSGEDQNLGLPFSKVQIAY
jgi:hypothetical protein